MSWRISLSAAALVLMGCPGGGDAPAPTAPTAAPAPQDPPSTSPPENVAPPQAREVAPAPELAPPTQPAIAPPSEPAVAPTEPRPPAVRRPSAHGLRLAPVGASEGEDGHGNVVPATRAFALDAVAADAWPVRALDPVLYVGALRFSHYTFASPGVLRFVVADVGALPRGAEVFVQYGSDDRSRVVLERSLRLP